jgi:hypothetical protein
MKKILIILCLAVLCSCRVETFETWEVTNNSSGDITVLYTGNQTNVEKSMLIPQDESAIVQSNTYKTKESITFNPKASFATFIITNTLGDTCTKDYLLEASWTSINDTKSPPKRQYNNYYFSVTDSDF